MSRAYTLAVQLLSRREHSVYELQRKLLQRAFSNDEIELALGQLKEQGLLSDARFTEQYVRMRRERGYGPNKVLMELKERGIGDTMATAFIDNKDEHWLVAAKAAWKKKHGASAATDFNALNKQKRFMYYRGYPQLMIEQVIAALDE